MIRNSFATLQSYSYRKRECKLAERKFKRLKTDIWAKLSFLEKSCSISLITDKFKGSVTPVILTQNKKLLNLWRKQSEHAHSV